MERYLPPSNSPRTNVETNREYSCLIVSFHAVGVDGHIELLTRDTLVQVEHVLHIALEVRRPVEAAGDEALVGGSVVHWFVRRDDGGESLDDVAQKVESRLDVELGVGRLGLRGDDGDVNPPSRDGVSG